ncbi:MAG TPA: hypothetical protein P5217_06260 [Methanoregulaceae archaeon]|nr:hypothetical protein [Methanoregulaceae archaeon]HPD75695.1 hypothetical protein [Methanoregulaceae archaeon]HRY75867.1 hypothetical protein [Methanoregulaceae archaeon]
MYASCQLTCHRCRHTWVYMGKWLERLGQTRRPVKALCPRCRAKVVMDEKNAR